MLIVVDHQGHLGRLVVVNPGVTVGVYDFNQDHPPGPDGVVPGPWRFAASAWAQISDGNGATQKTCSNIVAQSSDKSSSTFTSGSSSTTCEMKTGDDLPFSGDMVQNCSRYDRHSYETQQIAGISASGIHVT